jgi:hypothetical protein
MAAWMDATTGALDMFTLRTSELRKLDLFHTYRQIPCPIPVLSAG